MPRLDVFGNIVDRAMANSEAKYLHGCPDIGEDAHPDPADIINRPAHYHAKNGIEAIDVIEGFELSYHLGVAVAYILRHRKKGGTEDLRKAERHLHREITGKWE